MPDQEDRELIQPGDSRYGLIWINPARMSGTPCFYGTRVPVETLFDYLKAGDSLGDFLNGFAPITREHALAVLKLARARLIPESQAT